MIQIITISLFALIALISLMGSIFYVHSMKNTIKKNRHNRSFNKQSYVKEHRPEFGVVNRGTSMDGREIYVISPSDMGL